MGPSVLVVDDQAAFRAVARALLERDGFQVVGEAADAATAVLAERALRPDIVLLDVRLPARSGLEVARAIRAHSGSAEVVLTSTADYTHAVADCGARAFLPKLSLSGATLRAALANRP
jgi:DNA-binding NarL/FixJ family response regulator